jgi:hypothetical protein
MRKLLTIAGCLIMASCHEWGEGDRLNLDYVWIGDVSAESNGTLLQPTSVDLEAIALESLGPLLLEHTEDYLIDPLYALKTSCVDVYVPNTNRVHGYGVVSLRFLLINTCSSEVLMVPRRHTQGDLHEGELPVMTPDVVGIFPAGGDELVYCDSDDQFACDRCAISKFRNTTQRDKATMPSEVRIAPNSAAIVSFCFRFKKLTPFRCGFSLKSDQEIWNVDLTYRTKG